MSPRDRAAYPLGRALVWRLWSIGVLAALVCAPTVCSAKKKRARGAASAKSKLPRARLGSLKRKRSRAWQKALRAEIEGLRRSAVRANAPTPPAKVKLTARAPHAHSASLSARGVSWNPAESELKLGTGGAVTILYPLTGSRGRDLVVECRGRFPEGPMRIALRTFTGERGGAGHVTDVSAIDRGRRLKLIVDPVQRDGKWLLISIFTPRFEEYPWRLNPPAPMCPRQERPERRGEAWRLSRCTIQRLP